MRTLPTAVVALVVTLLPTLASAQPTPAQPTTAPATRPAYVGAFEYRYVGFRVRADVIDERRMRWTILEGGNRVGESAEEQTDRKTIAPGIEFVSWTEKDGTMVAQVVNLNAMRVTTVLIFNGRRLMLEGQVARLDAANE